MPESTTSNQQQEPGTPPQDPPTVQHQDNPETATRKADEAEKRKEERAQRDLDAQESMADSARKLVDPTWWAVIVGGVGVVLLIPTLWYSREAVVLARKTAEKELRAYVIIETGGVDNISAGKIPVGFIRIVNMGQTPAKRVRHVVGVDIGDYPPNGFDFSIDMSIAFSRSVIGPNGPMRLSASLDNPLTEEQVALLKNGTKAIYVWAEIRYLDGFFPNERITEYRAFCTSTNIRGSEGEISTLPEGNDYT